MLGRVVMGSASSMVARAEAALKKLLTKARDADI